MNPLRPYFAVLLILLIMAPLLFRAGFIVNFQLNRAAISEKQCVNKKQPEKKCDGKCHLKKMLDTDVALEKDNSSEAPLYPQLPNCKELKESPLFLALGDAFFPQLSVMSISTVFFNLNNPIHSPPKGRNYVPSVFHPPLV